MKIKKLEKEIEAEIFAFLKHLGILCWKNKSMGTYSAKRGTFLKNNNPNFRNGVSDILGVILGRPLAIEVKSKLGRPSEDQKVFLEEFGHAGGIGFIARSVEDVAVNLAKFFPEPQHENLRLFCKQYLKTVRSDH